MSETTLPGVRPAHPFDPETRLWRQFDPNEAVEPADPRWVDLDPITGTRNILEHFANEIRRETRDGRVALALFSGLPGSGKSSLLRQLQAQLDVAWPVFHVAHLDLSKWVKNEGPPAPGQLLAHILLQLEREAGTSGGLLIRTRSFFEGLARGATFEINLGAVAMSRTFEPRGPLAAWMEQIPDTELSRGLAEARGAVEDLAAAIRERTGRDHLVLVIDGLEKGLLRDDRSVPRVEIAPLEARAKRLYRWIQTFELPIHLVFTADPKLVHTGAISGFDYCHILPMAKIRDREGRDCPDGLELLLEVVKRRCEVADAEADIRNGPGHFSYLFDGPTDPSVHLVLRASGGYLRELMRLIRDGMRAHLSRRGTIPRDVWVRVVNDHALQVQNSAYPEDFYTLRLIHEDVDMREIRMLPEDDQDLAWTLVSIGVLLGYQNGAPWFDLHPGMLSDPRLPTSFVLPPPRPSARPSNP